jgi:hypothetical protein
VTIFFLTLYVTINFVAAVEKLAGDPSYRPTINVPSAVSLMGCLGGAWVMFLISPFACISAVGLEAVLYAYLRRRALEGSWGDARVGILHAVARLTLIKLRGLKKSARNWRPQIMLFTANPTNRIGLVRLASWFNQNRGLVTVCRLEVGDLTVKDFEIRRREREMDADLASERLTAFCEVVVVPKFEVGLIGVVQANGYAGFRSNCVMFGWPDNPEGLATLLRVMRTISQIQISTIFAHLAVDEGPQGKKQIDVWWRGKQHNGDLMLLLAHLLNLNPEWVQARTFVRSIVENENEREEMLAILRGLVADVRINAEPDVIVRSENESVNEVMRVASVGADLVFLGLQIPEPGFEKEYSERLFELAGTFPAVVFVRNAGVFAGELI